MYRTVGPMPDTVIARETAIAGVVLHPLAVNPDERGSFTEFFCDSWGLPIAPRQWSVVTSRARALRGMHLHLNHDELLTVLKGRATVGLHDLRKASPTSGRSATIALDGASPACLVFPRGVLHGWYFHQDSIHVQAVSEEYAIYHPHDNLGCHWADPALNIPWPDRAPIISARAAGLPRLADLKKAVQHKL